MFINKNNSIAFIKKIRSKNKDEIEPMNQFKMQSNSTFNGLNDLIKNDSDITF